LKHASFFLAFILLSCSLASADIRGISEKDGETYFSIDGKNAEFMGILGQNKDPLMWSVGKDDFIRIDQIIRNTVARKSTTQYDSATRKNQAVTLTDKDIGLLKDVLSRNYYRVYTAGTNRRYEKIMDVLYYEKQGSDSIIADVIVDLSTESLVIR
jgi:hypothetical protein